MNFDFDVVMFLALFTIGTVLVLGIISWIRARRAQDHHQDAAVAQRQRMDEAEGEPDRAPNEFSAPNDSGRSWSKERGANPPTPMPPKN